MHGSIQLRRHEHPRGHGEFQLQGRHDDSKLVQAPDRTNLTGREDQRHLQPVTQQLPPSLKPTLPKQTRPTYLRTLVKGKEKVRDYKGQVSLTASVFNMFLSAIN